METSLPNPHRRIVVLLAILIIVLGLVYYAHRITKWQAYDDEGGYLYAAWRISLGEVPYRDFLTPQLPVFLYPGALVLRLTDYSVLAVRLSMSALVLASSFLLFLTVRQLWGDWPALLVLVLVLVQQEFFWAARFFRPEAPMLFWATLAIYSFVMGYPRRRPKWLMLSGAAMGLSMISKLFGALPMVGLGLFLLIEGFRTRDWRDMLHTGLQLGIPFVLVVGAISGLFLSLTPNFVVAVLGHHLKQGGGTPFAQVLRKGLKLYWEFAWTQPAYALLAIAGLLASLRAKKPLTRIFACQVPTALAFLLMTRDLQGRHLTYLVPSMAALTALGLGSLWDLFAKRTPWWQRVLVGALLVAGITLSFWSRWTNFASAARWGQPIIDARTEYLRTHIALASGLAVLATLGLYGLWTLLSATSLSWLRRGLACALVAASLALALLPHWTQNTWVASWEEHTTQTWVEYIQAHTAPDAVVMSDYPGLNFYARRRTTPLAAGISRGAASSGQIMGADLIREIQEYDVQMVLLNVAHGAHQFVRLQDYSAFKHYLQTHFFLAERRKYDYRLLEIYARQDFWPGEKLSADFGHQLKLTGYRWLSRKAAPGENLQVALRWQGMAAMPGDYYVTLQLLDDEGHLWGLGSKRLVDLDKDTWWDEEGLERAVLVPTSRWPLEEATIQVFELPVDLATPPGAYTVQLRVHPQDAWNGLPLLDARGAPAGYDFEMDSASIVGAANPPALDELPIEKRVEADLSPDLRLIGYNPLPTEVRPGDRVALSMFWTALAKPSHDYQLGIALQRDGRVWAQIVTDPVRPDYPTSHWRKDEVLRGQYDFVIDAEIPSGDYALQADLLADGRVIGQTLLSSIKVVGRQRLFEVPLFSQKVGARLGDVVTLLGYDLPDGALKPGSTLPLTLYWRAEQKSSLSLTVFTHLIGEQGQIWGQRDSVPVQGTYPATAWLPGEIIIDEYAIPVQQDAPAGIYTVQVGMYDGTTGLRLSAADANGQLLDGDRIPLGQVTIAP